MKNRRFPRWAVIVLLIAFVGFVLGDPGLSIYPWAAVPLRIIDGLLLPIGGLPEGP